MAPQVVGRKGTDDVSMIDDDETLNLVDEEHPKDLNRVFTAQGRRHWRWLLTWAIGSILCILEVISIVDRKHADVGRNQAPKASESNDIQELRHSVQELKKFLQAATATQTVQLAKQSSVSNAVQELKTSLHSASTKQSSESHAVTFSKQSSESHAIQELRSFLHAGSWSDLSLEDYDAVVREMEQNVSFVQKMEGHSGGNPIQKHFYHGLAKLSSVHQVCEIGFNGGHSSANWLSAKPGMKLVSFDLGIHDYTRPRADFLKSKFPGQFNITYGSSLETVPKFHREHPGVKCDIVVVDGGHSKREALLDLENMRYLANQNFHVLLIDDIDCIGEGLYEEKTPKHCKGPEDAIVEEERQGNLRMIEIINTHSHKDEGRGFGAGYYIFA